jgi:predicted phage-related endonuclease
MGSDQDQSLKGERVRFAIINADQRSPEWFQARAGRLTGSRAADVLATIKSGEASARRDYRMQLVTERLTGQPQEDGFVNAAMLRGIELEPLAFAAYEAVTGNVAIRTGFLSHVTHLAGCSLDGHVDNFAGIVELKCPKSATHLRYLNEGVLPKEYIPQVTHNAWISGAEWVDFLSYDDRFPPDLQVFYVRVLAKDLDIEKYEKSALAFLAEVDESVNVLIGRRMVKA